jgi:single-strand DNA-binding protein
MAQVMGRLTGDATVRTLESGKQLVEFSLAENFHYKTKSGDAKNTVSFYNCVFWNRPNLAPHLQKGTAISIKGRITAEPYKDKKKQLKATLKFTVNSLEFLPATVRTVTANQEEANTATGSDLPF